MAQNPTSWIPMAKSLTSKKFSFINLPIKILLGNSVWKKNLTAKVLHKKKKHAAKSKRAEKNRAKNETAETLTDRRVARSPK